MTAIAMMALQQAAIGENVKSKTAGNIKAGAYNCTGEFV